MKNVGAYAGVFSAALFGVIGGYGLADIINEEEALAARRENYTDRGRICIEAAAMIRNGESKEAIAYLEDRALHAIRGVPMGRDYVELPEKSQVLLVSARRYETAFSDVDLEIDRLTSRVPDDHESLSASVRSLSSSAL